ncbi:hypothetical protein DFH06DRAFT_729894 [Mycena polygramma]|nr:hypothetical protein DFH06DRAFT_729894 [Mycena polygramma]
MSVEEKTQETFPSDPGWMHKTLSCMADCGTTALLIILKTLFFAILPISTLLSTLALPFLGCLPDDKLVAVGMVALVLYQLAFLATFAVVLDSRRFWACSLSIYFEKTRRRRGHLALMSPRRYRQYLRRHRFSIFVHGTEAEHPVHLRVCRETPLISIGIHLWRNGYLPSDFTSSVQALTRKSFLNKKMNWSDTVGEHDLGTLSIITLTASLLGGATGNTQGAAGNAQAGSSRPGRGKATAFFTALKAGAAEPEPTKRRRKATHHSKKDQGEDSSDGGEYSVDLGDEDKGEETDDSDKDMVVDGSELADSLPAKTDPKAGRTRSKDTGKSADKGKGKATAKPPKKKRKTARTSSPIVIVRADSH